jgi:regulator of sigma E protease
VGNAIGDGISTGIYSLLYIVVFITINLGVVNLLAASALDGGRLVFLLFELVTRKKVNPSGKMQCIS